MKKLLCLSIFLGGFIGNVHADMGSSVGAWLTEGDARDVCPKIGAFGRSLAALPKSTKAAVLYKCENVFLGVGKTKSDDSDTGRAVHPRAYYAVLAVKPATSKTSEEEKAYEAANMRRAYLIDLRKQGKKPTYTPEQQKIIDDAFKRIAESAK